MFLADYAEILKMFLAVFAEILKMFFAAAVIFTNCLITKIVFSERKQTFRVFPCVPWLKFFFFKKRTFLAVRKVAKELAADPPR